MKKLNNIIEKIQEGKMIINKIRLSMSDYLVLLAVQEELKQYKRSETITKNVADICLFCGLKVTEQGIGWRIVK